MIYIWVSDINDDDLVLAITELYGYSGTCPNLPGSKACHSRYNNLKIYRTWSNLERVSNLWCVNTI